MQANASSVTHRTYIKALRSEVGKGKADAWNGRSRMIEIDGADNNTTFVPIHWRTQARGASNKCTYMHQKVMTVLEHGAVVKVTMYVFDPQVNLFT